MRASSQEYFASLNLTIEQPKKGYRFGEDTLALADFIEVERGSRVCDICSGVGVLACIIARRFHLQNIVAVELQEVMHAFALRNLKHNALQGEITCIHADYRDYAFSTKERFDLVVSNPPYRKEGSGRLSSDPVRRIAHHELYGDLKALCFSMSKIIVSGGHVLLVWPPNREEELLDEVLGYGWQLYRQDMVADQKNAKALYDFLC
jgi:tRNA1Val (adenine37-N6)-methyltransferase